MPDASNELLFSFLGMTLSARGAVASVVAIAVSILIIAVAWRVAMNGADAAFAKLEWPARGGFCLRKGFPC